MMDNIGKLSKCIRDTIRTAQEASEKKEGRAQRGEYHGSTVIIGGQSYPASLATAVPLQDGCAVWVQISSNGKAVIIGV